MKSVIISLCALLCVGCFKPADNDVTLQLKWVAQAQFAGYYVALDKGFYSDENLNVTIKAGGPAVAPPFVLASGDADIMVDWMPSALATRVKGLTVVNVGQPYKRSGMMMVCRKDSGINSPEDLAGKTVGVWYSGNQFPFLAWMDKLGFTSGPAETNPDVTVFRQAFSVDPLLDKTADCVSAMAYNEYFQVLDGGLSESELTIFRYEDEGVATLEDGLYVLQKNLSDKAFVDKTARFVRASMKGWHYAQDNPDEAADIVLKHDEPGILGQVQQRRMMREVNKLTRGSDGKLSMLDYQQTVDSLLTDGDDPVISGQPVDAWTHAVTDKANM